MKSERRRRSLAARMPEVSGSVALAVCQLAPAPFQVAGWPWGPSSSELHMHPQKQKHASGIFWFASQFAGLQVTGALRSSQTRAACVARFFFCVSLGMRMKRMNGRILLQVGPLRAVESAVTRERERERSQTFSLVCPFHTKS